MALQVFGVCYWLIDVQGQRGWVLPLVIFGVNPLAVFVLSGMLARLLTLWEVTGPDGAAMTVKGGSLLFAICYVLLWPIVMAILYGRKWLLRV